MSNKKIVIFKESFLSASEGFVLNQACFIKKYKVILVGLKKINSINLGGLESFFVEKISKIQILTYKLIGFCPALKKLLYRINPTLIHIHMGGDGVRFSRLKNLNIPYIVTFHGTDASTSDSWKRLQKDFYTKQYLQYRSLLIGSATHFIAISQYVKKCMIEQGYPKNKITVHYIGIDTDFFKPKPCSRKKNVVFVGRLIELKGCHILLQAMNKVQREIPETECHIIGGGPELENLKELSNRLDVRATFHGVLDKYKIRTILNEASVFCVPSIKASSGGSEGLGMVFLEAQAMGVPIVSFSTGGIPEAVINNETGFLYSDKNVEGLSEGITKLLTNKDLWTSMSKKAIQHIKDNFDIKNQSKKLEDIYDTLINCGKGK